MTLKSFGTCFACLMMTSGALARYEGAGMVGGSAFTITSIHLTDQGAKLAVSPAPAGCLGGTHWGEHFLVELPQPDGQGRKSFDAMYSTLLTAFITGQNLTGVWYGERTQPCNNEPSGLLIIHGIKFVK